MLGGYTSRYYFITSINNVSLFILIESKINVHRLQVRSYKPPQNVKKKIENTLQEAIINDSVKDVTRIITEGKHICQKSDFINKILM